MARDSRAGAERAGRGASRSGGGPASGKVGGETRVKCHEDERDQRSFGTPCSAPGWVGSFNWTAGSGLPRKVGAAGRGRRAWLPGGITPRAYSPEPGGRGQPARGGACVRPSPRARPPDSCGTRGARCQPGPEQVEWSPAPSAPHPEFSLGPASSCSEQTGYHHGIR